MDKYKLLRILTDKRLKALLLLSIFFLMGVGVVFAQTEEVEVSRAIACLICRIMQIFFLIAAGIAALVIVIAGIKWIGSGDDPGARNAAKSTIVSAIIGLVIVLIAVYLVSWLVSGFGVVGTYDPSSWLTGCPSGPGDICEPIS